MEVKRKTDDSLQHHGVKGQRWGIRRYQNKDGTLTAEGQKKYNEYKKTANKEITADFAQTTNALYKEGKKYSEEYNEAVKAGKKRKAKKIDKKIDKINEQYHKATQEVKKQRKVIDNYKLSDFMKEEKISKRKNVQKAITSELLMPDIVEVVSVYASADSMDGINTTINIDAKKKYRLKQYNKKYT